MRCKLQSKCLLYVFVYCFSRNSIERGELLNKPVMLPRPHVTPVFGTSGTLVPTWWQEASKQLIELHFSVKQVSSVLHNTPPTGPAPDPANLNSSRSGSRDRYRVTLLPVVVLRSGVLGVPSERNCIRSPYVKQHVLLYQVLGVRATEFAWTETLRAGDFVRFSA